MIVEYVAIQVTKTLWHKNSNIRQYYHHLNYFVSEYRHYALKIIECGASEAGVKRQNFCLMTAHSSSIQHFSIKSTNQQRIVILGIAILCYWHTRLANLSYACMGDDTADFGRLLSNMNYVIPRWSSMATGLVHPVHPWNNQHFKWCLPRVENSSYRTADYTSSTLLRWRRYSHLSNESLAPTQLRFLISVQKRDSHWNLRTCRVFKFGNIHY
jgi:hypothetical protein